MFGNASLPSRIWSFGADAPHAEDRERVENQYRAAHRYRNTLCEIELRRRAASEDVLRQLAPDLVDLDQQTANLKEQLDALRAQTKAANSKARLRVTNKEDQNRLKTLRQQLKGATTRLNTRRRELYASQATKTALTVVKEESQKEIKQARAQTEAYWGSYLAVEQSMAKAGQGPPPRYHRWTGEGRLAVQLQNGLTMADMFAGQDRRFRLISTKGQDYTAYLRIGSDGQEPVWARINIRMHRKPPNDALLKWVYLIRRREGTRTRWWLQLVLSRKNDWPQSEAATSGRVAVDMNFRLVKDGMRVAYWVGEDGLEGQLVIPTDWVQRWQKPKDLRSTRDQHFDVIRPRLVEWLKGHGVEWLLGREVPDWLRERTATLRKWKSPAKLAALVLHWRENRFAGDEEMFLELEAWRKQDKHLFDWEGGQRGKLIRWRNDLYCKFSCMLMRQYKEIVLEKVNWRELARVPVAEKETDPGKLMRQRSQVAAVGRLSALLQERMQVIWANPRYSSMRCAECGKLCCPKDSTALTQVCEHCGFEEDRDRRACRNLLSTTARGKVVQQSPGGTRVA